MRAMGELLLTRHDYRSFADFVGEYLGPQASFYLGWTYWLSWVVTCIADVVVCGSYTAVLVPGTVGVDAGPQHAGDSVPA